jgi:hypothetical protein
MPCSSDRHKGSHLERWSGSELLDLRGDQALGDKQNSCSSYLGGRGGGGRDRGVLTRERERERKRARGVLHVLQ